MATEVEIHHVGGLVWREKWRLLLCDWNMRWGVNSVVWCMGLNIVEFEICLN